MSLKDRNTVLTYLNNKELMMNNNGQRRRDTLEKYHYNCWWVKEWFRQDIYYHYNQNKRRDNE